MILAWMLFATAFATLVGAAAMAAEHVAAGWRRPRRMIWLAALVLSVAWPVLALFRSLTLSGGSARTALLPPMRITATVERASALMTLGTATLSPSTDRVLLAVWAALSTLLLLGLVRGMRALERRRRGWRAATVDGVPVRLAPDAGPAVIGFRTMEIVLPEWLLDLDTPLRALVVRHEEEHRRAGDPMLMLIAALATALAPWNPALWWQARRIRLALEMDCDARVLGVHPTPERYGLLLLTIAQRRAASTPLLAPALSEPASNLERRIVAMHTLASRGSVVKIAVAAALAATAIVVACAVDAPSGTRAAARAQSSRSLSANQPYFEFQVTKPATVLPGSPAPVYPEALRKAGVEGQVLVQFVVGADGRPDMSTFKVLKSTDPRFVDAIRPVLARDRFTAGEVRGQPVKQVVQMPFVFSLSR